MHQILHRICGVNSVGLVLTAILIVLFAGPQPAKTQGPIPEWDQVNVLPATTVLEDVWAFGAPDTEPRAFAVGRNLATNSGVVYFYDGISWTAMPASGVENTYLASVWGVSADAAFAVGDNVILRFDGTQWIQMALYGSVGVLRGVWASGPNDAFAVGEQGRILHYTGPKPNPFTEWAPMDSGTGNSLSGVWGSGPNNVWAVGGDDLILHYDGTQWTEYDQGLSFPEYRDLRDIHGIDADNIIAVGDGGLVHRFNGSTWEGVNSNTTENLYGGYVMKEDHAFAVGYSGGVYAIIGTSCKPWPVDPNEGLTAISGADDRLIAVGFSGGLFRADQVFTSSPASKLEKLTLTSIDDYYGIWGSGANDIFVVGDNGRIVKWNGANWSVMSGNNLRSFHSVWGSSSSNVFAAIFDRPQNTPYDNFGEVNCYDGSAWSYMSGTVGAACSGLWGSGPNDVFVVGDFGRISHFNGSVWSNMNSGIDNHLYGIWGSGSNDVFAVGESGVILHYSGSTWSKMPSGTASELRGIWGSGPSDVFAVSSNDVILHFNGSSWSLMNPPTSGGWIGLPLNRVWGSGPSNVFAVGDFGEIYHYDGTTWGRMNSGTTKSLKAVWGSSATDVYAVGEDGLILHYPRPAPPPGGWFTPACCAGGTGNALPIAMVPIATLMLRVRRSAKHKRH